MSSLLGFIFSTLSNLFGNFLPSWSRNQPSDNITHLRIRIMIHPLMVTTRIMRTARLVSPLANTILPPFLLLDGIPQVEAFFAIESNLKAMTLNFLMV